MQNIRIERHDGGIARVIVARADSGNASSPAMLGEIRDGFAALGEEMSVRAIVLSAEGRHFSVGADFAFLAELPDTPATQVRQNVYSAFQGAARAIYHCPKPTLALVQGAAITVGCELALACDFRIAAETARFQESWIRLGILPPLGGLFLLPRMVGLGRAMELCLRGTPMLAAEAKSAGLVSEVVPPAALETHGMTVAAELASQAPLAYALAKQAMQRGLESSMEVEWQANLAAQTMLLGSADFREGLAAVTAKRAPTFIGG
jgi:enoyl-CoA hydratase/carnithine racemase